jgi:uncharacterized membrane protein
MHPYLKVFLLSLTPVGELRLSIPMGILAFKLPWLEVFLISIIGNILPAIIILVLFEYMDHHFRKIALIDALYTRLIDHSMKKKKLLAILGYIGLLIFVAIPAPGTGAWTGAFLAGLLGFKRIISIFAIFGGLIVSATVVTLTSMGIFHW